MRIERKRLTLAVSQIERQFGKGAIMKLGEGGVVKDAPVVSPGSLGLDIALGIGGVPRGRVMEIYGPESSGKTTLALQIVAEAQKLGGMGAYIDAEHALDLGYAKKLGVKTDDLLDLAAGPRRTSTGNCRDAGPQRRHRCFGHRLRRGAWCQRRKSKARWATPTWACRPDSCRKRCEN